MLDLYKLEHLIAVTEEGSFTRAARRLHMSQQALSSSIRALEREVGVQLLARDGSTVTVLPAGEALVTDARALHGAARTALNRARRIGRDETENFRLGHTPAVTSEEVTSVLQAARVARPGLAADVHQRFPRDLEQDLLAGDLDLGLCRAMAPVRGLARTVIGQHRLRVAVAADHRLADRPTVELRELAEQTIMVWGLPKRSGYTDLLIGLCQDAGFEPLTVRNPIQGTPPITAVIGGEHVAFVTAPTGPAADGRVRVLDLEPPTYVPIVALWPRHTRSAARDELLRQASSGDDLTVKAAGGAVGGDGGADSERQRTDSPT